MTMVFMKPSTLAEKYHNLCWGHFHNVNELVRGNNKSPAEVIFELGSEMMRFKKELDKLDQEVK